MTYHASFTGIVWKKNSKVARVDVINSYKQSPLHTAVETEDLDISQLLTSKSATIDAIDFINETPLHYAAFSGQLH